MTPPIDTTQTLRIAKSPGALIGLVALGVVMTGLCAYLLASPGVRTGQAPWVQAALWVGVPFFGLCTLIAAMRAFGGPKDTVILTPTGLTDIRVSADEIPWSGVQSLGTWSSSGQRVMVVAVDPETESRLRLTTIARMTRKANRSLGADGLCVTAQGIRIGYDALLAQAIAYREAAAARAA